MRPLRRALRNIKTMAAQLVSLPEVERLSPSCIRILGGNPSKFTLQGTNTYLIGRGSSRLLIDTGEGKPSWIAALKQTLAEEKATIKSVLLTHWHHDHVLGVRDVLQYFPDTIIHKHDPEPGWMNIEDGQVFEVDGATLTAVHTPGHTVDHMVFVFREEDALFTGDNVLGHGTAVFEDLGAYIRSLEKMGTLASGCGYPGHGSTLENVRATILDYISHRQEREKQVLQTLSLTEKADGTPSGVNGTVGAWTPMELVKIIYRAYPENLHLPAAGGVVQILRKLEEEGKVLQGGGGTYYYLKDKDRSSL
ncbi:metallo-beta-lactamase domain-containing protein [Xylariales sp. PMI_506]|nr:metallo-beta-lactamase domain-containing protein [Xylariales sp. PMI_506]